MVGGTIYPPNYWGKIPILLTPAHPTGSVFWLPKKFFTLFQVVFQFFLWLKTFFFFLVFDLIEIKIYSGVRDSVVRPLFSTNGVRLFSLIYNYATVVSFFLKDQKITFSLFIGNGIQLKKRKMEITMVFFESIIV